MNHQLFLSCLNCISDFFPHLRQLCAPLYKRLGKNLEPSSNIHTDIVRQIEQKVESLPCVGIPHPSAFMIVETDASEIGYGGILRQRMHDKEQLVLYHSNIWLCPQQNYSTIKKKIIHRTLYFEISR